MSASLRVPGEVTFDADAAIDAIRKEYIRATDKFTSFNSAHEGYAVVLEELDELWAEIKQRHPNHSAIREEAVQLAAMALRFLTDVCGVEHEP